MNLLLEEIAKPLTEREHPWQQTATQHILTRGENETAEYYSREDAERILYAEDRERLIAEVTRLQSQADEAASTIARLEGELREIGTARDEMHHVLKEVFTAYGEPDYWNRPLVALKFISRKIRTEVRNNTLEEAAKICENLYHTYTGHDSSGAYDTACGHCEDAIRSLRESVTEPKP